jgi:hypothetical protein
MAVSRKMLQTVWRAKSLGTRCWPSSHLRAPSVARPGILPTDRGPRHPVLGAGACGTASTSPAKAERPSTRGQLNSYDTRLKRLAQDLQNMAAALGPFIQEEHTVVG